MPDTSPIFGIPHPLATGEGADLPTAMEDQNNRLEEIFAAGIRSSGKSVIATEQSTSSSTYAELGTPDRVEDIVLPTDGLIVVAYQARWKCSAGDNAGRAAIFIGTNQVKAQSAGGAGAIEASCDGAADRYRSLFSSCAGLDSYSTPPSDGGADATTGQLVGMGAVAGAAGTRGGLALIFAAAGTYDISVKFKASSGSVTAKERKLWVASLAFGMPPA